MDQASSLPADDNPYAPSAVVDPRLELAEAGVGAWRDGSLIVLHRDATLPAICLKTGPPAGGGLTMKVAWRAWPFSLHVHPHELRLPLSPRRYWLATRLRWWLLAVGIVILFGIPVLVLNVGDLPEQIQVFTIFGGTGLAAPLLIWWRVSRRAGAGPPLPRRLRLALRRRRAVSATPAPVAGR
jgi:hypothetical protein